MGFTRNVNALLDQLAAGHVGDTVVMWDRAIEAGRDLVAIAHDTTLAEGLARADEIIAFNANSRYDDQYIAKCHQDLAFCARRIQRGDRVNSDAGEVLAKLCFVRNHLAQNLVAV